MANRLAAATSPYLLQHADNPVDWWEWSDEAFAEARRRDVPIFLSVGYAACHWCHVMAHESFEDPETAKLINDSFVAIKVDREERPDVDAVYMQATQAMTGQGGWPMSVFLTQDQQPFYAGTYFPPQPHHGLPAFAQVLDAVSAAWRDRRDEVLQSSDQIIAQLAQSTNAPIAGTAGKADLEAAMRQLKIDFDPLHAGFGRAPKFPPSMVLEALLRDGSEDAMIMASQTLEAMARGGIYDQLGGGFARYSVDAQWIVPHFEKMLYDNALLLGVYAHWWAATGAPIGERVVRETVDWLQREMLTDQGAFAASLDADSLDSNGKPTEGAFYAWDQDQLVAALGAEEGAWAAEALSVTPDGTFEHGLSTLQHLSDVDHDRFARIRADLLQARDSRSRPGRDDKVVAAWNGWLIESLTRAALIFDEPDWLALAQRAAELLWQLHWVDGRLRRTSRAGVVGRAPAILEDYGAVAQSFVRLGSALADPMWIDRAALLIEVIESQFDSGDGGFFDTAADAEQLYSRPRDSTDNATPSGLSSTIHALALMAEFTGDAHYVQRAEAAAASAGALVRAAPRFAGWLHADAVSRVGVRPPVQIAIVGDRTDPATLSMINIASRLAPGGSVLVAGNPDQQGISLLQGRPLINGRPTAYVCRGFVCRLPVTSPEELAKQLSS